MYAPTIVDAPNFNADEDCENLKQAFKGFGCDKDSIVAILCNRSINQRKEIASRYKQLFGKELVSVLESELKGDLEDLVVGLFYQPIEYDCFILKKAMKGMGTDELALVDVLCTRSNQELVEIKQTFQQMYGKDLEKEVSSETSGDFKKYLMAILDAHRTNEDVDEGKAREDADKLHKAGAEKLGTDESTFFNIMSTRSYRQLRATFAAYEDISGKSFEKVLDSEFSGDVKKALYATARCAHHGRQAHFAERIHDAISGVGTNEDQLTRLIVSRCSQDMEQVRRYYTKIYNKEIEKVIEGDTSGAYKNALVLLSKGNNPENDQQ